MTPIVRIVRALLCVLVVLAISGFAGEARAGVKNGDKFGDWIIACEKPDPNQPEACYLVQTQLSDGARLLQVTFAYRPDGTFVGLFTVPLGILIPTGVAIKIDEGEQLALTLIRCLPDGCRANIHFDKKVVEDLKKAKKILVGFADGASKQTYTATISTEGMAKGMNALK
ncbi:MAG: invasion associated locus B family protein [Alphaproteobacteria bacterium]